MKIAPMADGDRERAPTDRRASDLWREMVRTTPNRLTTLRLASIPVIWALALLHLPVAVGILLALAALTDALDGYLARTRNLVSDFGKRYDSIADHLLTASTVGWLLLLRPEFFQEQKIPLLVLAALGVTSVLVGWIRLRRIGGIHLYSAKAAMVAGYGFAVYLLIFGTYPVALFYVALAACFAGMLETLIVQLTRDDVDRIGSIFQS